MPCIFCKTSENLTQEHVFPAFSGADLTLENGSCKECNGKSSKFEDKVALQTETARHIFGIPNRYGRVPSAAVAVEVEGIGRAPVAGRRWPDAEIELYDYVENVKTEGGKNTRQGFFVSEVSAQKFIERSRKRGEKVTELDVPREVTLISSSQQTLEFAFSPESRKTVAKIALVSVAYKYGAAYACLAQFDALRTGIFGSAHDLPLRIFANKDFANDQIRIPTQHSVRAYLSAGMHKGWAIVTLFGGLSYVVELTRAFNERDSRQFSLFYDTDSRSVFTPIVLYDEREIIGRVLSHGTEFEQIKAIDAQWYPIVESYCKQNGLELSRIVSEED